MRKAIKGVEEFYAHAIAIEREAMERYAEFEAWFRDRGEEVLAGLCANLARMEADARRCARLRIAVDEQCTEPFERQRGC